MSAPCYKGTNNKINLNEIKTPKVATGNIDVLNTIYLIFHSLLHPMCRDPHLL